MFAAAFSLEAASAVTGHGDIQTVDIAEGLASLVGKSLVTSDTTVAAERFINRLLETIRAYAAEEKLAEGGESRLNFPASC